MTKKRRVTAAEKAEIKRQKQLQKQRTKDANELRRQEAKQRKEQATTDRHIYILCSC